MNETTKNGETFTVSHGGVSLPLEMYSMEYILKELENNKLYFGEIRTIEHATKAKIKNCRKGKNEYFAYIKFFGKLFLCNLFFFTKGLNRVP